LGATLVILITLLGLLVRGSKERKGGEELTGLGF
jgi:hypothetical protein